MRSSRSREPSGRFATAATKRCSTQSSVSCLPLRAPAHGASMRGDSTNPPVKSIYTIIRKGVDSAHEQHTSHTFRSCCGSAAAHPDCFGPPRPVSYTHLRAHETPEHLVC